MAKIGGDISNRTPLSQLWQLPVLLLGLGLIGLGLFFSTARDRPLLYAEKLDHIETRALPQNNYPIAWSELDWIERDMERRSGIPDSIRGRVLQLQGDVRYLSQRDARWEGPISYAAVVRSYQEAERVLGRPLSVDRQERLADSLVRVGRLADAYHALESLGDAGYETRQRLLRRMIKTAMMDRPISDESVRAVDGWIGRMRAISREFHETSDASSELRLLAQRNEIWSVGRRAELLMHGRVPDYREAESLLQRWVARWEGGGQSLTELRLLLGEVYLAMGEPLSAMRSFNVVQRELVGTPSGFSGSEAEEMRGRVLLGMGKVLYESGAYDRALEHFEEASVRFSRPPVYGPALIGRAECALKLGLPDRAVEELGRAVDYVVSPGSVSDPRLRQRLAASLRNQQELMYGRGDYARSLNYLAIEERLHGKSAPPSLYERLARTHERLAEGIFPEPTASEDQRKKWAEHIESAAHFYRKHADAVASEPQLDSEYGESLWKAADLFAKAGMHDQAIRAFAEHVAGRPSDPRRLDAMFRLADVHRLDGQFDEAIEWYQRLNDDDPNSPQAIASLIPMARSYLDKGKPFWPRAERVLLSVIKGHPVIRPGSGVYREALIELAKLYDVRGDEGDYARAIDRYREVIARDRVANEATGAELMFHLGDVYRKSVEQISMALEGALPPSHRQRLEEERSLRYQRARESFDDVIRAYGSSNPKTLSDRERLYLRNSYFYRADSAYELGRYAEAIKLYEETAQRYEGDPAKLVALVQIVNCYSELGEWDRARAANERAKKSLRSVPDEAFNDPENPLPMDRKHWQRWLDTTSQLVADGPAPNVRLP